MEAGRTYELTLLVHPEEDQRGLDELIDWVRELIAGTGGQVENVNALGRRRLAYPIKKCIEGQYVVMRVRQAPEALAGLEPSLKLQDRILRYLFVRREQER